MSPRLFQLLTAAVRSLGIGLLPLSFLLLPAAVHAAGELKPWKSGATPALVLRDDQGTEHRLSALRGRPVLVNFWATWCEPCRAEMPSIVKLKKQMAPERLEVLAVNLGESEQKVDAFLKTLQPEDGAGGMTVLFDHDMSVARAWKATLAPASFIIGPDGRIAYSLLGEADWNEPGLVKVLKALAAGAKPRS